MGLASCGKHLSEERIHKLIEGFVAPGGAMDYFHYIKWVMSVTEEVEGQALDVKRSDLTKLVERFTVFWPRNIIILFGPPGSGKGEYIYILMHYVSEWYKNNSNSVHVWY